KLIKYNFGIDAEWYARSKSNLLPAQLEHLESLNLKYRKNHLISIAIEDWQTDTTHFYEHIEYGKRHINKIWRGLSSLCELIDAEPLQLPLSEQPVSSLLINLHFFFSPYDICAFVGDEALYRQICLGSERKRIFKTRFQGRKGVAVDRSGYFKTPWYVIKNEIIYQIKLNFIDYSGISIDGGYEQTCAAYGILLKSKSLMDDYKSQMNLAYDDPMLRPDFIKYNCADVKFKQLNRAVIAANNYIRADVFNLPLTSKISLTKGAETAKLFWDFLKNQLKDLETATIPHLLEYDRNGILRKPTSNLAALIKNSAVKEIVKNSHCELSKSFLAIVMGGRCKNEIPHRSASQEPIVSMDLKSCYGNALKYAFFPLGRPVILQYPLNNPTTWISLACMLEKYEAELVPGCWHAVIDTAFETLSFNQSLFVSNSATSVELKVDFDDNSTVNVNGNVGIYLNQIKNGILTHHSLQTAKAVMSQSEWDEFSTKVKIKAMAFHPSSLMVKSVQQLIKKHQQHQISDLITEVSDNFQTTSVIDRRCRYWFKFPISKFIDPILQQRELLKNQCNNYSQDSSEYFELNSKQELLKLCVNSLYGALASQYFHISNSIVGNNITDKARSACFIMASTTNAYTSITDGSESPLMRFLRFKSSVSMAILTNYRFGLIDRRTKRTIISTPLGRYDWNNLKIHQNQNDNFQIDFPNGRSFTTGKSNQSWDFISIAYNKHIQAFFGQCNLVPDWVNQYSYEDKGIFKGIAVQSAANYLLEKYECDRDLDDSFKIKARGNSPKKLYYSSIPGQYHQQILAPMKTLMNNIYRKQPIEHHQECFVEQILKVNDWNKKIELDPEYPLLPGETISRKVKPFAIKASAFYYPTIAYRETLEKFQDILESQTRLGLGVIFANNSSYKYDWACFQIQADILRLNQLDFKSKYTTLIERITGTII
ncbi:MAG: hypothetical protein QNJ38_16710, partial [Prochloraceae cyanobacterium]|nr:hypothetical protein [Prochloraceae cyanobacterium]